MAAGIVRDEGMALYQRSGREGSPQYSFILCRFCQNNGEDESWYRGHVTRSPAGKVLCPVLRVYTCPVCAVIGDNAHTSSTAPRTGGEVFNLLQEASG